MSDSSGDDYIPPPTNPPSASTGGGRSGRRSLRRPPLSNPSTVRNDSLASSYFSFNRGESAPTDDDDEVSPPSDSEMSPKSPKVQLRSTIKRGSSAYNANSSFAGSTPSRSQPGSPTLGGLGSTIGRGFPAANSNSRSGGGGRFVPSSSTLSGYSSHMGGGFGSGGVLPLCAQPHLASTMERVLAMESARSDISPSAFHGGGDYHSTSNTPTVPSVYGGFTPSSGGSKGEGRGSIESPIYDTISTNVTGNSNISTPYSNQIALHYRPPPVPLQDSPIHHRLPGASDEERIQAAFLKQHFDAYGDLLGVIPSGGKLLDMELACKHADVGGVVGHHIISNQHPLKVSDCWDPSPGALWSEMLKCHATGSKIMQNGKTIRIEYPSSNDDDGSDEDMYSDAGSDHNSGGGGGRSRAPHIGMADPRVLDVTSGSITTVASTSPLPPSGPKPHNALTVVAVKPPTDDWEYLDDFTREERLKALRQNNAKDALLPSTLSVGSATHMGVLDTSGVYVPTLEGISEADFLKRHPHAVANGRLSPVRAIVHQRRRDDVDEDDDEVDAELMQGYTGDAPSRVARSDSSSPFSDAGSRKRTKPPSQGGKSGAQPGDTVASSNIEELHAAEDVPATNNNSKSNRSSRRSSRDRSKQQMGDEDMGSTSPPRRSDDVSSTDTHQPHDRHPPPPTGSIIIPLKVDSYHSMAIGDVREILKRRIHGTTCDARNLTRPFYCYHLMQLCAQLTLLPTEVNPSEKQLNDAMRRQNMDLAHMSKSEHNRLSRRRASVQGREGEVLQLTQLDLSNTQLGPVGPMLRPPTRFDESGEPILDVDVETDPAKRHPTVIAPLDVVWIDERSMPEPLDIQYRSVVLAYAMWPVIMSPSHNLTHLILDNCGLTDFDAYTLATILRHRKNSATATSDKIPVVSAPPLNTLSLRLNDISDDGVVYLKKAVKYHRKIEHIWLEGNHRINTTTPPPSENKASNPRFLTPFIDGSTCGGNEEVTVLRERLRANVKRNQMEMNGGSAGCFGCF